MFFVYNIIIIILRLQPVARNTVKLSTTIWRQIRDFFQSNKIVLGKARYRLRLIFLHNEAVCRALIMPRGSIGFVQKSCKNITGFLFSKNH